MKQGYQVRFGEKSEFAHIILNHHYLSVQEHKGFRVGVNVVLVKDAHVVGVCIFTGLPVPELSVGMFGLSRNDQEGLYELSRFCLLPEVQKTEHNIASWFLARAIKLVRKSKKVRAILSYADSSYHTGTLYRAYGFKYYGLTAPKKDWKRFDSNKPNSRGCEGHGEWVVRSQKHRYLLVYDAQLSKQLKWKEQSWHTHTQG